MRIFIFKTGGSIVPYILKDVIEAFKELGFTVEVLDLSRSGDPEEKLLTPDDIIALIKRFGPDFVFGINYLGFVSYLVTLMKIHYVCWFVDSPSYWTFPKECVNRYALLFVVDRKWIRGLKDLGFEKVYYLPGATNPKVFKKISLSKEDIAKYQCRISFVGNSTYSYYKRCCENSKSRESKTLIDEAVRLLAQNPLLEVEDILEASKSGSEALLKDFKDMTEIRASLEYAASAISKKEVIEEIYDLGLHLYGDKGWRELIDRRVRFLGHIDYHLELPKLYNASEINLNMTKPQLKTAITPRILDISSCGGFVLTDYRSDLTQMFDLNEEIVFYRESKDLRLLIEYYLEHPSERKRLAKRAQERVLKEHTYLHRMKEILGVMKEVV
ncbi:TPA: hypothetical protein DCX15_02455 [bacterium]|nr:hypothetical protein [bacterium]